jgi:hypothetical protein
MKINPKIILKIYLPSVKNTGGDSPRHTLISTKFILFGHNAHNNIIGSVSPIRIITVSK